MQAVILAAGMGRRLAPLTNTQTKCMVKLHDRTLIERSLDALTSAGVDRIVLVVGYGAAGVQDLIGDSYQGVPVHYVRNDEYATTNNIWSLHLAREEFAKDDTLLLEGDLVYDPSIIDKLLKTSESNVAIVAKHEAWMDGTVVTLGGDNRIQQFIPKRSMQGHEFDRYYKTVNIYKFSRDFIRGCYLPFLDAYIRSAGTNEYYEQVLRVVAGLDQQELVGMPLTGEKWYEIDDIQDYEIAETLFAPESKAYDNYLNRHGGYWRFPNIVDFCYLVNPYFPTPAMADELHRSFDRLLREYPSSARVVDHLAAKMFDCEPDAVIVGNGAAELITELGSEIIGKRVAVPVPTFEEYLKRFPDSDVLPIEANNPDLRPELNHLMGVLDTVDVLVLINPDNPSGQCLSRDNVLTLASHAESTGKLLILDESFVDFAEPDFCSSVLTREILAAYPKLVIIKSISKSYGVPGARLGVIATSDAELLRKVATRRSVWNINSFAEYFLQIIGKYQDAYAEGCATLRTERSRLAGALDSIPGVRVIPSQANFVLCELGKESAATMARRLLIEHQILVKDASEKPGLNGREFIRVAVRGSADNDSLIQAMQTILSPVSS